MVTKNGRQREIAILDKIKGFWRLIFRELDISTTKYQKSFYYVVCRENSHHLLKHIFWYLLVLYVNFSVKRLKFALKWQISYFQTTLAAIFVT